jgi:hypothetical protein
LFHVPLPVRHKCGKVLCPLLQNSTIPNTLNVVHAEMGARIPGMRIPRISIKNFYTHINIDRDVNRNINININMNINLNIDIKKINTIK